MGFTRQEPVKVAGVRPRWAPFPGFSWLLREVPSAAVRVSCDFLGAVSPACEAYRALWEKLKETADPETWIESMGFYFLHPDSWHVTFLDGVNIGNLGLVAEARRPTLEGFLEGLWPDAEIHPDETLRALLRNEGAANPADVHGTFRISRFCDWGVSVVALLESTGEAGKEIFQEIAHQRVELHTKLKDAYGVTHSYEFHPHLTIGYFKPVGWRKEREDFLVSLNKALRDDWELPVLEFEGFRPYGFTDMETFFPLRIPEEAPAEETVEENLPPEASVAPETPSAPDAEGAGRTEATPDEQPD